MSLNPLDNLSLSIFISKLYYEVCHDLRNRNYILNISSVYLLEKHYVANPFLPDDRSFILSSVCKFDKRIIGKLLLAHFSINNYYYYQSKYLHIYILSHIQQILITTYDSTSVYSWFHKIFNYLCTI